MNLQEFKRPGPGKIGCEAIIDHVIPKLPGNTIIIGFPAYRTASWAKRFTKKGVRLWNMIAVERDGKVLKRIFRDSHKTLIGEVFYGDAQEVLPQKVAEYAGAPVFLDCDLMAWQGKYEILMAKLAKQYPRIIGGTVTSQVRGPISHKRIQKLLTSCGFSVDYHQYRGLNKAIMGCWMFWRM